MNVRLEKASDDGSTVKATIIGDPAALTLRRDDRSWRGGFDVRFVQRTAQGGELGVLTNEVALNMAEDRYRRMLQEGFVVSETVDINPSAVELRVLICEHLSGAIGSVFVPLRCCAKRP